MATRRWRGDSPATAQITTITPANPSTGDVFTCTINGKSISYTVLAADMTSGNGDEASAVAAVVDGLVAAWNASTIPEFAEVTASDSTTTMTLTADTAGKPFTVTASSTNDGSATNEVQSLSISGTPTGGTFTLTYDGQTTSGIAYNASAATVQSALEALSNVAVNDIVCTGGALPGTAVTMTFSGTGTTESTNVKLITGDGTSLTGGTSPAVAITTTTQGLAGADTLTANTTTSSAGPNHWDTAANWSGAAVPVDADDVVIDSGAVSILYGLDQSAVTPTSITITQGYTGTIGLPETNSDATATYREYRDKYLKIGASADATNMAIGIGGGIGSGSGRIKIDCNTSQATVNVSNTGQAAETGVPSLLLLGSHASNVLSVSKGSVGVAHFGGETATVATLNVGYRTNVSGDATVTCGSGCTLTTINQSGGTLTTRSNVTTVVVTNGEMVHEDGAMTTLSIDGGAVRYKSTGTLTTINVGSGGVIDCRQDMRSRTFTNVNLYEGFSFYDPFGSTTVTNGWDFVRCIPADGVFDIPPHRTLTLSTI